MNIPLCILPTKETLDFLCETPFVLPNSRIFSADLAFKASGGELEKAGTGTEERIRHCETVLLALSSAIRTIV